jgi:hypothetical protein
MIGARKVWMVIGSVLVLVLPAWAQRGQRAPQIPGLFKPVVGAGAQYAITTKKGEKYLWSYAIVGKETVQGVEAYWTEMRMESGGPKRTIMKTLMVTSGPKPEVKRMIMQMEGQPPMEMPMEGMMGGMMSQARESTPVDTSLGEKVGTEMVTVPAGTFLCDHYRKKDPNGMADLWMSSKVTPYGAVKVVTPLETLELTKLLTNETSQIKGEPKKFEIPRF